MAIYIYKSRSYMHTHVIYTHIQERMIDMIKKNHNFIHTHAEG